MIVKINKKNSYLINNFIKAAGNTLKTFTYFNTRDLSSIDKHIVTFVGIINDQIVSYGHLDKEDNKIWLGIAVSQNFTNKGLGNQMMKNLIFYATKNNLKYIYLSVSNTNHIAYKLYEKFGFKILKKTGQSVEYVLIT